MCTQIFIYLKMCGCQLGLRSRERSIGNLSGFYYSETFTSIPISPVDKLTFHSYACLSVVSNVGTT